MAQVGIVRIGGAYFREYAIEPGDTLTGICLRFGHTDWRAVYKHPANAAFRTRFPDPNQIDFNSVNLFIPLAGATTSGKTKRGKPVGDYYVAKIEQPDGTPLAAAKLVLLGPGLPAAGKEVVTTADGDIIVANPDPGEFSLVSPFRTLTPKAAAGAVIPSRVMTGTAPVVSDPVKLTRNAVDTFVARGTVCLRCPMCWTIYAVTAQSPSGSAYTCPNDRFDWTPIVKDIHADLTSYLSVPFPAQDPSATPATLKCRGVEPKLLATAHGSVRVFWDESRFAFPDGGDYQLWGRSAAGAVLTAQVIGRHTWGAAAPRPAAGREYKFHLTVVGASVIYTFPIPNNESTPLESALKWITVHHTTDSPLNSFATAVAVQKKHFIDIADTGPGADIGYHFVIDGNGDIYEGRPLGIKGSHTNRFNGGNVGIVLAGDFERFFGETPTAAAVASLNRLVDVLAARFGIRSAWWHLERNKQTGTKATDCPGARLIPMIAPIRATYPGPPT
jgi:hypothetical protein